MSIAEKLNFFVTCFVSLFAIVNPFGNAPIFLTFTEGRSAQEQNRIALRASLTSLLILLVFIFLGKGILFVFRITICVSNSRRGSDFHHRPDNVACVPALDQEHA
jgi:small neutral amino acid transporter SnatA (MarC family)